MTPAAVASVKRLAQRNGKKLIDLAIELTRSKSTNGVPPKEESLEAIALMAKEALGQPFTLKYQASGETKTRSGIFQGIEYDESSRRFMVCFEIIRNEKIKSLKVAVHDLTDLKADDCTNGGGYC